MTATAAAGSNPSQRVPSSCPAGRSRTVGAVSGLPLAQRTAAVPVSSISTAVPACSTDCPGVAASPLNP